MTLWRERKTTGLNETILSGMKTIGLVLKKKFLEMFRTEGLVKLFSFVNITHSSVLEVDIYYNLQSIHLWKWLTFRHRASSIQDRRFATLQRRLFIYLINKYISLYDICLTVHHWYNKYRQATRCNNNGLLIIRVSSTCFGQLFCPSSGDCVTACGIMHPRCYRPPAGNIVRGALHHKL